MRSLLFLIWSGVFFYFQVCVNSAVLCTILVVAVLSSNVMYLLVLAQRCVREWGKTNFKHLEAVMHKLHLDALHRPSKGDFHVDGSHHRQGSGIQMTMVANPVRAQIEGEESVVEIHL